MKKGNRTAVEIGVKSKRIFTLNPTCGSSNSDVKLRLEELEKTSNATKYTSKPLKDFIYESNKGKDIFFVQKEQNAIEMLSK